MALLSVTLVSKENYYIWTLVNGRDIIDWISICYLILRLNNSDTQLYPLKNSILTTMLDSTAVRRVKGHKCIV